jgi:ATP-dependent DNA helicase RecG
VSSAHNQETQPQQSHNARVIDQENSIIIMTIEELLEALKLGEDQDLEFKAAQGGLPRSAWETVSAFANTTGGTIVLGVAERDGKFEIVGVNKPQTLIKDFWDTHNSPQKINYPICRDSDVTTLVVQKTFRY